MADNRTNDFEIFINDILDNTGKIALKYFRDIKDLSLKRDMSPVTKAVSYTHLTLPTTNSV